MNDIKKNLQHYRCRLKQLAKQANSVAEQVGDAAQTVELDQNRVGRLSRMDAMQGQAMARASADRQIVLLKAIDQALLRIDSGDYGRCIECDAYIAAARLDIDPTATLCIQCAQQQERA